MIEAAFNFGDAQSPNWRNMHMCLIPKGGATVPPPQSWPDLRGTVLVWDEGPSPDGCIAGNETPWAILNPTLPSGPGRWLDHTQPGTRLVHSDPQRPGNLACTGHTWTADGRLFVTAGNEKHGLTPPNEPPDPCILGGRHTYLFDARSAGPADNAMWVRQIQAIATKRWYPAVVLTTVWIAGQVQTRVLVLGGNHQPLGGNNFQAWRPPALGSPSPQQGMFDLGPSGLEFLGPPPAGSDFGVYPYSHLMSDGQVVVTPFLGLVNPWPLTTRLKYEYDSVQQRFTGTWTQRADMNAATRLRDRAWGCSLLMPNLDSSYRNSVIQLGGSPTANEILTDDAQICRPQQTSGTQCWPNGYLWTDLPATVNPQCSVMQPMRVPRYAPNAVVLPEGSFLVIGGQYVMDIERYDGAQWNDCASLQTYPASPPQFPGGYGFHSTALLLPSGKVLIGGGNLLNPTHLRFDFQVYSPWYIVAGLPRPKIVDVNGGVEQVHYDQIFRIKHDVIPGVAMNKVVLMRPGSVTHGFNSDQRYIELEIIPPVDEGADGEIMARMPPRAPGHPAMQPTDVSGPPGFYMLFLVSTSRVPSEAAWIELLP